MDNTEEFRLLSLCSGYGGLELGLRRIIPALRAVAYVEVEAFACANLVNKMETDLLDAAPIWTDIKTFDARAFRDRVHIITAGYPCQPFSSAGSRRGKEDPRYLWPYIERVVKTVRPAWCFFENVEGHLKIGFGDVYRGLRKMGYAVEAGLFSAAEIGAPHRRKRLFILAHNPDRGCEAMQIQQAGQSPLEYGRKKLADAEGDQGRIYPRPGTKGSGAADIGRRSKLANTQNTKRRRSGKAQNAGRGTKKAGGPSGMWPARPGQAQYEWEEPRTVGNADCSACGTGRPGRTEKGVKQGHQGKTEPRLGLSANGTSCGMGKSRSRIDELRLLGNGIVPQQAEKAFRILIRNLKADR